MKGKMTVKLVGINAYQRKLKQVIKTAEKLDLQIKELNKLDLDIEVVETK